MLPTQHIALYGSRRQDGYEKDIMEFIRLLHDFGVAVTLHDKLADALSDAFPLPEWVAVSRRLPADVDVAISFGGDGTFLRTARWVGRSGRPVLGVNTGHLGFLADNAIGHLPEIARAVASGEVAVERWFLLKVEYEGMPREFWPYALNEVAFLKEETSSMINVDMNIDGNFLADYRADGLIVSTPTGSTAYALSAGGPIVEPTLSCMVLAPIAPHTLTLRPLVVGGDSLLEATVTSRSDTFRLSLDGRSTVLPCGSRIHISRADYQLSVIRMLSDNFPSTLRRKLLWGN